MSLIVLSNSQEEYEQTGFDGNILTDSSGIQNPASFHNHLTNVFKVPPNSEIALQSIKCSRSAVANIRQGGKVFSIYLGAELSATKSYSSTCNIPIKCYVGPGVYSVEELRIQILNAMNQGLNCHPDYWNQCQVVSHFVLNQFAGYTYTWNCIGPLAGAGGGRNPAPNLDNTGAPLNAPNPESWWWRCNNETSNLTAPGHTGAYINVLNQPGTGTLITQGGGGASDLDCMFQYAKVPLSQMGGYFSFNPFPQSNWGVPWSIGLSRPTTPKCPCPEWCSPEVLEDYQTFFDYVCVWKLNQDDIYALFVYHAVAGVGDYEGELSMEQVKYWEFGGNRPVQIISWGNAGADAQITQNNFNGTAGYYQIDQLRFEVQNENVALWASYSAGGFPATWGRVIDPQYYKDVFDDSAGPTGEIWDTTFAPINQNKWYLYPKIALEENLYSISITDYDYRNADEMKSSFPNDVERHADGELGTEGDSWYGRTMYGRNIQDRQFNIALDVRPANTRVQLASYTRKIFETTTGASECPDYIYALLPASSGGGINETRNNVYSSDGGNSQDILGFQNVYQVLNRDYGTRSNIAGNANIHDPPPVPKWVLSSAQRPTMPTASTFLRLTGLTHQSYNFAKSLPSKIIYHFPRFDNSGNNVGPLFYETNEKTYVALNNAEELNITDLKVDMVNLNEEIVNDLQGTTIVVLHIKSRR